MSLGSNVRRIRKNKGFSMMKINELTGISKSTISELENDKSSPTSETLKKIASALDVPVTDFFDSKSVNTPDIPSNQLGYFIEKYLYHLGINIIYDFEGNITLDTSNAQYEISELDIKNLQESTDSFIKFKIFEIMNKNKMILKSNDIPIAAHNDFANDEIQQKLMQEDLDEL